MKLIKLAISIIFFTIPGLSLASTVYCPSGQSVANTAMVEPNPDAPGYIIMLGDVNDWAVNKGDNGIWVQDGTTPPTVKAVLSYVDYEPEAANAGDVSCYYTVQYTNDAGSSLAPQPIAYDSITTKLFTTPESGNWPAGNVEKQCKTADNPSVCPLEPATN